MRALVFDGEPRLTDIPMPPCAPGEALVRVLVAGVCNTDLEITRGYMEFRGVPGHEFVGIVEHSSNEHLLGKRVVGEINCPCGICRYCQLEMPTHCENRTVLGIQNRDGAFAEYLTLPEANLHIVPASLPDNVAVFTEPVAAAFRITEQIAVGPDDRILVLGDGKLGQLAAQVLWLKSKNVLCVGKHEWKLELLRNLHITTALSGDDVGNGWDIVVEATGSRDGLARSLQLVRPEGTVVMKTTVADPTMLNMALPVVNEIKVIGSRCGPFRPAIEALALGNVKVRPMITETYPLVHGDVALKRAADPDVMKVLVQMQ